MTIDPATAAIMAALIGFLGAILGGLVVAIANYYFAKRLENQRRESEAQKDQERIKKLIATGFADSEGFLTGARRPRPRPPVIRPAFLRRTELRRRLGLSARTAAGPGLKGIISHKRIIGNKRKISDE